MSSYAAAIPRPPRTHTELEQATLLKVAGEHRDGFRDHVIFAVALGTGLREHEIAALDVGDVLHEDGRVRRRIALRMFKRSSTEPATQEVFIPDSLWYKLGKTKPGKCLMTVNRKSANKIRDFLQKKPRGIELMGALMERLNDQDVPMPDHHELRIVDATPDDGFQDQHVLGGGSVVAERLADRLLDYQPADAPLHSSLDPKEPDTSPGSRGKSHPRSKKSSKKK